ncbi:sugar phosphotransferase, partial [Arthrobacter deserti]|nr:sugar phosphotransferase [Arthrobacter deserti]
MHPVAALARQRLLAQEESISNSVVPQDVYYGAPEPADGTDVVEVTSAAAVARFEDRDDVVKHKGRYALVNRTLTPHEAMVEDLLFIRGVLDGAGLPYLLVRGNDSRPVVAVDWEHRRELLEALVQACRNEPMYSMTVDAKKKTALLVA